MKIVLEFDDFSPRNSNFGLLEDLKDHFKGFKVSLFSVPWDIRWGEPTPITDEKYIPFVNAVNASEDWIEICVHGLTHMFSEFKTISYDEAKKRISIAEKMLINRAVKYAKIFKAPHWELSPGAKRALTELGFIYVEDGYYNWNLADEFPEEIVKKDPKAVIIAHGHIQNVMNNGLEEVMPKLLALPAKDVEWMFLSEYLKSSKVNSIEILESMRKLETKKRKERYPQ